MATITMVCYPPHRYSLCLLMCLCSPLQLTRPLPSLAVLHRVIPLVPALTAPMLLENPPLLLKEV